LTEVDTSGDEDDKNDGDGCRSVGDEALLFDKDYPPEYYIQQLRVFDETVYERGLQA
jgi:hypothetical protein